MILSSVIDNTLSAKLIVITDQLLQSSQLLSESISSSSNLSNHLTVLISSRSSPPILKSHSSHLIRFNTFPTTPFLTTAATTAAASVHDIDLDSPNGLHQLQDQLLTCIQQNISTYSHLTILFDSINTLIERDSYHTIKLVKQLVKSLPNSGRIILFHHADYPTLSSSSSSSSPSLLATLLSPTLCSSTLHLILHPSPLLELFSREYGLSIPLASSTSSNPVEPLDLRLNAFLDSFESRAWGNPFLRPTTSSTEDERIPLDLLGEDGQGREGCVVEWSGRGISFPSVNTRGGGGSATTAVKRGEVKKVMSRGLEGMRWDHEQGRVRACELSEVLRKERMARVTIILPSTDTTTSTTSTKPLEPILPFNLSLTDSQKIAREAVVLPYLPKPEGGVEYVPDEGDDMDEDDPDEDLEV